MVAGNIFIGFDFYHAGVYGPEPDSNRDDWPGYEAYGHDLDRFYLVVNAFLIRFETGSGTEDEPIQVAPESSPELVSYLSLWGGPADRDTSGLSFVTLDRETIRDLSKAYHGWRMLVTPVPLPPGLDLDIGLTIVQGEQTISFSIQRQLGADAPPFAMGIKGWIAFARDNFIQIPIKAVIDLSPAQRKTALDWVVSSATTAVRKREAGEDLSNGEEALLESISSQLPLGTGFRDRLSGGELPPYWSAVAAVAQAGDAQLPPPRPVYQRDQLQDLFNRWDSLSEEERTWRTKDLFGKQVGSGNDTYLEFVGVAFRVLMQNAAADPNEAAQRAREGIARLLGFGERLRWPVQGMSTNTIKDLMVLRWGRTRSPDQFVTNAHSLLGLVFRLGPYNPRAEITEVPEGGGSFLIGGGSLTRLDGSADATFALRFAKAVKNLLDDVRTSLAANAEFKAALAPAHANGILFVRPRSLQMEVAKGVLAPPDGQHRLLRVPTALLDALDDDARAEYPPIRETDAGAAAGKPLHYHGEPQRLIHPADLFMDGGDLELDQADRTACATFQVKVNRLMLRFADRVTPATPVYEVRFTNKLKAGDLAHARARMDYVLANSGLREGELWVTTGANNRPEKTEAFDLAGRGFDLAPPRNDKNDQPIYTIVDDGQGTLTRLVGSATANPSGETGEGGPSIQFDLVLKSRDGDPFNMIIDARGTEDLFLHPANVFTTRLSRSVERLQERFDATLSPAPLPPDLPSRDMDIDPADNNAVRDDLGNFKKLRLELWPQEPGVPKVGLTYPASLQPLPSRKELNDHREKPVPGDYLAVGPDGFTAQGPHFGYWLAHQFTEEIVGNLRDDGDAETLDDDEAQQELGRYALYTNPGPVWSLTGHLENVYNHRIPVTPTGVHLGLSVDLRSLASARSMKFTVPASGGEKPKSPVGRIALRYEIKIINGQETLVLTLDKVFIQYALEEYRNQDASDEGRQPGRLRFLYEALADLKHCLAPGGDPGHVMLALERWNFDNRRRVAKADDQSAVDERSLPSILGNLRCEGRATRSLTADQVKSWTDLLAPTFDWFVTKLEATQSADLPIKLPVKDGGWIWVFGEVDAIGATTNLVRLGLSLKRAGHVTATVDQADGTPVLLREELEDFNDGLFGYNENWDPANPASKPYTPEGEQGRRDLLVRAAASTRNYLESRGSNDVFADGSALHKSFRWVATTPPQLTLTKSLEGQNTDPDPQSRRRRIFGPAVEFSHFPPGLRENVTEASKLYLVLYAIKPVRRHKFFRDGATTEMFLQYLIDLLADLLAGRHTSRITLSAEEMDATTLYKHRANLKRLADDLARKLVATFLDRVDDVDALLDPQKERQDRLNQIEETIDDEDVKRQVIARTNRDFDAFAAVNSLAEGVKGDQVSGSDVAIRSMIRKDPAVVNWAKGFAVGVFDPTTFSDRLFSFRIRRRIGPLKMTQEGLEQAENRDRRFHGEPMTYESILRTEKDVNYFVEALPDSVYQHSFWISKLGSDMRARTAEDVIENENRYGEPGGPYIPDDQRNLALVADHFNPEWQLRPMKSQLDSAEERYFLPSRDAPITPVPMEPETGAEQPEVKGNAKPKNPWYSEMFYREKDRVRQEPLKDIFQERLRDILTSDESDGTELGKQRIMITPSMAAKHIDKTLAFAELPDGSDETTAAGWHFIDTYLSHFLFILTPDEEAEDDPHIGLRNDTIPLEIQRYVKLPPEHREAADETPFEAKTGLHGWFAYSRAKAAQGTRNDAGAPAEQKPPAPMSLENVIKELNVWINGPAAEQKNLGDGSEIKDDDVDDLFRANPPSPEPAFRPGTARLSFDRRNYKWKLVVKRPPKTEAANADPADDGVGSIVAVDMMQQLAIKDGVETPVKDRVILRVTVLDETRTRTRARARIMRNQVDADGDLDGDLNPAFVRVTPYSEWATYPPYLLTYTEDEVLQFPDPIRFLVVGPESGAANSIKTLEGWIKAQEKERDFGAHLIWKNALNRKLETPNGPVDLFTLDTRTDTALDKPFLIDGSIMQMLGDHIHRAEATLEVRDKISARHDAVVTQLLRPAEHGDGDHPDAWRARKGKMFYTATAKGFAAMMKHMDRKKIKSADPNVVVTWYTPEGVPIMEINWPVVWHDELDD